MLLISAMTTFVVNMSTAVASGEVGSVFTWLEFTASVLATYILARLSLVFPALAIDQKVNIRWAWKCSENNGWRLVATIGLLPLALSWAFNLFIDNWSSVILTNLMMLLSVVIFVVEIVALSLSYRELCGEKTTGPDNQQHTSAP